MIDAHRQAGYSVRTDWGLSGAQAISPGCDVAVVIDVLSFTTSLTVAADRGATVYPFPWRDDRAAAFAGERNAVLAVGRTEARPGQVSLSPHSIRAAVALDRLVLPSPNGSMISFQRGGPGRPRRQPPQPACRRGLAARSPGSAA